MGYWRDVRSNGRRYWVTTQDLSLGQALASIVADRRQAAAGGRPVPALVSFRQQFRRAMQRGRIEALFNCLEAQDAELARLAIWLMSRMHRKIAIAEIAPLAMKSDLRLRREVARAVAGWGPGQSCGRWHGTTRTRACGVSRPACPRAPLLLGFAASRGMCRCLLSPCRVCVASRFIFESRSAQDARPERRNGSVRLLEHIRGLVRGH